MNLKFYVKKEKEIRDRKLLDVARKETNKTLFIQKNVWASMCPFLDILKL